MQESATSVSRGPFGPAIILALGMMAAAPVAATTPAPPLPVEAVQAAPQLHVLGQGVLRFLFWKVYDIALYGADARWREDAPYALAVVYARSFSGDQIAGEGVKQMRHLGYQDAEQLARWRQDMLLGFPGVHPGDQVAALFSPPDETRIYLDGRLTADIHDQAFSHAFFGIWLDPRTDDPTLRAALLGQAR